MDNIITILECLRDLIIDEDAQKSFDMSTAALLEMLELLGHDSPVMVKLFPLLEQMKNAVQKQHFDDALPIVQTLLIKFRKAREINAGRSCKGSDEQNNVSSPAAANGKRNQTAAEHDEEEISPADVKTNVVRLPLAARNSGIAEKLTAPGNQDLDSISAGIERLQLDLPGHYMVVTWVTRVIPTGYLDAIWYLSSFDEEAHARRFASAAVDQLIEQGSKPEPTAKAFGPRLKDSIVSAVARTSLRISSEGRSEEDHVTFIVLGPFPAAIVGLELIEMFESVREKRALKDFFAFHGPDRITPPEWIDQYLSREEPGNLAFTMASLTPLMGLSQEQLQWAESRITKLNIEPSIRAEPKTQEAMRAAAQQNIERILDRPDPCSLDYWCEFMHCFYPGLAFFDYASAFRGSQPPSMAPDVKRIMNDYTHELNQVVFAVREGAVLGWWLDENNSYVVKQLLDAAGVPSAHVEVIAFGEASTPPSASYNVDSITAMERNLFMRSTLVSPAERAAFLRGGMNEVEKLKRQQEAKKLQKDARADAEAASERRIRSLKDILDNNYTVEEVRSWFDAKWYSGAELKSETMFRHSRALSNLTPEQSEAVRCQYEDMLLTICYSDWDSTWRQYRNKGDVTVAAPQ